MNGLRSFLYLFAKLLGDVQAVEKAARTGRVDPITKRVGRRLVGKLTGRAIGRLFR